MAPTSGFQGVQLKQNHFAVGDLGYNQRNLEEIIKMVEMGVYSSHDVKENQALVQSPAMAAFVAGYDTSKMNLNQGKYELKGKLKLFPHSNHIRLRVRKDTSENVKGHTNFDEPYTVQKQSDLTQGLYKFKKISDTVTYSVDEMNNLQGTEAKKDYIEEKVRFLSEGIPDALVQSSWNETLASGSQVVTPFRSIVSATGDPAGIPSASKNKKGEEYWKPQTKTTSSWFSGGSSDADSLMIDANKYSKRGMIDMGICNKNYFLWYKEELKAKGLIDITGMAKRLEEQGYSFPKLMLEGVLLILEPNLVLSTATSGKCFYINSNTVCPNAFQNQVDLSLNGQQYAKKVWLSHVSKIRPVNNLTEVYYQAATCYFTWTCDQQNANAIHTVTAV